MSNRPVVLTPGAIRQELVRIWFLVAFLSLLAAFPVQLHAQTYCIPPAVGVPALPGPPVWWDQNGNGTFPELPKENDRLNDPRWQGALGLTYGTGGPEQAAFRALHDSTNLYLSWNVEVAPNATPTSNILYWGFQQSGGGGFAAFKMNLTTLTATVDNVDQTNLGVLASQYYLVDGAGNPTPQGSMPPWFSSSPSSPTASMWVNSPANTWAIQLVVPLSALNVNGSSNIVLWYEILDGSPSAPVWTYKWPVTIADVTGLGQFPAPGSWGSFHISTGAMDPACPNTGVSLSSSNISSTNTFDGQPNEIAYGPVSSPPQPVNTIWAMPTNHSGSTITAGNLQATFRIANWGSLPDWNDGVDPATLWTAIPGGSNIASTADIPDGATATNSNITFKWTVEDPFLTDFTNGVRRPHQCILVELSGTGSSGSLVFINKSVYNNFDLAFASEVKRAADISVAGLKGGGPKRDVYLYVQPVNMPSVVETIWKDLFIKFFGAPGDRSVERTRGVLAQMSAADIEKTVPIYRVFVFNDSGNKITIDGKDRPILHPQSAFGFYVIPHGDVIGWVHKIQGATEIAPNFYRIAVPKDGKVTVTPDINALEVPQTIHNCCGKAHSPATPFASLLGMLAVGLVSYRRKNRKS